MPRGRTANDKTDETTEALPDRVFLTWVADRNRIAFSIRARRRVPDGLRPPRRPPPQPGPASLGWRRRPRNQRSPHVAQRLSRAAPADALLSRGAAQSIHDAVRRV